VLLGKDKHLVSGGKRGKDNSLEKRWGGGNFFLVGEKGVRGHSSVRIERQIVKKNGKKRLRVGGVEKRKKKDRDKGGGTHKNE